MVNQGKAKGEIGGAAVFQRPPLLLGPPLAGRGVQQVNHQG